jgi:hypothetical protein
MDERQTKIRAGAGLEESRINTDLIEFLNKWSSPVLIVIGLIGLGWAGMRYLERSKVAELNNAFAAYEGAVSGGNPSPASLRNIAGEYAGTGAIAELALLRTVDLYLQAAISGVEPGAEMDPLTGRPVEETDLLDADGIRGYLSQARDLSRQVADLAGDNDGRGLIRVQALMRLGAAEEGLGSVDAARESYAAAAEVARQSGLPELAVLAENRSAATESMDPAIVLPSQASLTPLPGDAAGPGAGATMSLEELMSMQGAMQVEDGADPIGEPMPEPSSDAPFDPMPAGVP